MILRSGSCALVLLLYIFISPMAVPFATAQAHPAESQKGPVANQSTPPRPADVAGDWQVSWQGRLGTAQCVLHLQQDGSKLTGTLQDSQGISQLTGSVDDKKISFEVHFTGKYPFTTQFSGTVDSAKIEGTSEAVGVAGGAFLGHAGEIVHPEHPWTAKRVANQSIPSDQTEPNQAGASAGSSPSLTGKKSNRP